MPTPSKVEATQACELRGLLDRLADKWSLLVVELLGSNIKRFSELDARSTASASACSP